MQPSNQSKSEGKENQVEINLDLNFCDSNLARKSVDHCQNTLSEILTTAESLLDANSRKRKEHDNLSQSDLDADVSISTQLRLRTFREGLESILSEVGVDYLEVICDFVKALPAKRARLLNSLPEIAATLPKESSDLLPSAAGTVIEAIRSLNSSLTDDVAIECLTKLAHLAMVDRFETIAKCQSVIFKRTGYVSMDFINRVFHLEEKAGPISKELTYQLLETCCEQGWCPSASLKFIDDQDIDSFSGLRKLEKQLKNKSPVNSAEPFPIELLYEGKVDFLLHQKDLLILKQLATQVDGRISKLTTALNVLVEAKKYIPRDNNTKTVLMRRVNFYASNGISPSKAISEFAKDTALGKRVAKYDEFVRVLLFSKHKESIERAKKQLRDGYSIDQHPRAQEDPKYKDLVKQTAKVFKCLLDSHMGFANFTHIARIYNGQKHSLLAGLGRDIAEKTSYVYSSDPNAFPGRGVVLDCLDPARFMATGEDPYDPFKVHKEAFPWLSWAIDNCDQLSFLFVRGIIAVKPLNQDNNLDLTITLEKGRKEPYSIVFFNDHFSNLGGHKAFLVPSLILNSKLHDTLIDSVKWESGIREAPQDVSLRDLTHLGLISASERYGSPVLNLGTPSVYGGGLCNAFPPKSEPYWTWESRGNSGANEDMHGHVHKSLSSGYYEERVSINLENTYKNLRFAHNEIFELVSKYQSALNLFKLAHSYWNKGQVFDENGNYDYQPYRLLDQARTVHECLHSRKVNPEDFPVLRPAPVFQWASNPTSEFALDTFDLKLYLPGSKTVDLSKLDQGDQELVWDESIVPSYSKTNLDLRFFEKE